MKLTKAFINRKLELQSNKRWIIKLTILTTFWRGNTTLKLHLTMKEIGPIYRKWERVRGLMPCWWSRWISCFLSSSNSPQMRYGLLWSFLNPWITISDVYQPMSSHHMSHLCMYSLSVSEASGRRIQWVNMRCLVQW